MTLVFLAILVAVIGIFFMCDCDFFLYFAQYNEINSFSNQVIWITGASGGIGASLAKKLTSSGNISHNFSCSDFTSEKFFWLDDLSLNSTT
jgi:hypothetical protein